MTRALSEHHRMAVSLVWDANHIDCPPEVVYAFACTAPPDAPCRTYPDCGCEVFTHHPEIPDLDAEGHRYETGRPCWVADWAQATTRLTEGFPYLGDDAVHDYEHPPFLHTGTIDVTWEDGFPGWRWHDEETRA